MISGKLAVNLKFREKFCLFIYCYYFDKYEQTTTLNPQWSLLWEEIEPSTSHLREKKKELPLSYFPTQETTILNLEWEHYNDPR